MKKKNIVEEILRRGIRPINDLQFPKVTKVVKNVVNKPARKVQTLKIEEKGVLGDGKSNAKGV